MRLRRSAAWPPLTTAKASEAPILDNRLDNRQQIERMLWLLAICFKHFTEIVRETVFKPPQAGASASSIEAKGRIRLSRAAGLGASSRRTDEIVAEIVQCGKP
jgi:hypothetical protein